MWTNLRHGRMQELSFRLDVSRQRIDQLANIKKLDFRVIQQMRLIEIEEMQDRKLVKKIIKRCAELYSESKNPNLVRYAKSELKRWIQVDDLL